MAGEELGTAFLNGLQDDPFAAAALRQRRSFQRTGPTTPLDAYPTPQVQQAPLGPLPTPQDIEALNRVSRPPQPWQGASPRIAQPPAGPEQDFMRVVQQQAQQPAQPAWQRNLSPAQIAVANAIEAGGRKVDEVVGPAIPPELRGKAQAALQIANAVDPTQAAARVGPNLAQGKFADAALDFLGAIPAESLAAGLSKLAALPLVPAAARMARGAAPAAETLTAAGMIKGDRASAGYSNVKAGTPVEEMTWKIEGAPELPKRNVVAPDKAFKVGDEIIPIVGDATRAGGRLTEVGGRKLTKGYEQEGGPDYARLHANEPVEGSNAQRVWANAGGPATSLTNLGKKVQERGNNPVLAYMTMNKEGGDFSKQMYGPTLDLLRQQGIGQKLERVIDNIMRSKHQAGNPVVWPGFASKKLDEYLANAPGAVRAKLAKALDSKRVLEAGGPDIGMLRVALTNPDLYNTPTGYMGYHIADFDPRVSKAASGHSSYPHAAIGTEVRGLGGSVPPELILPDLYAGLQKMGQKSGRPDLYERRMDYYGAGRAPQAKAVKMLGYPLPKTQVVTNEMIEKLAQYVEKHGLKSIPPAMLTALAGLGLGGNEAQAQEAPNGR